MGQKFAFRRSTWLRCYVDCIATLLEGSMPELDGMRNAIDMVMLDFVDNFESSMAELAALKLRHDSLESETQTKIEGLLALLIEKGACSGVDKIGQGQLVDYEIHAETELFAEAAA